MIDEHSAHLGDVKSELIDRKNIEEKKDLFDDHRANMHTGSINNDDLIPLGAKKNRDTISSENDP